MKWILLGIAGWLIYEEYFASSSSVPPVVSTQPAQIIAPPDIIAPLPENPTTVTEPVKLPVQTSLKGYSFAGPKMKWIH